MNLRKLLIVVAILAAPFVGWLLGALFYLAVFNQPFISINPWHLEDFAKTYKWLFLGLNVLMLGATHTFSDNFRALGERRHIYLAVLTSAAGTVAAFFFSATYRSPWPGNVTMSYLGLWLALTLLLLFHALRGKTR